MEFVYKPTLLIIHTDEVDAVLIVARLTFKSELTGLGTMLMDSGDMGIRLAWCDQQPIF